MAEVAGVNAEAKQAQEAERDPANLKNSKPAPNDVLLPTWPHPLRPPPKTVTPTEEKTSKYLESMGDFLIQTATGILNFLGCQKSSMP